MRVLIDYRPALREPTGAGEYTHQLVRALIALTTGSRSSPLELTLFSSSWKDRLLPSPDLAGAAIVDRRVPVRVLNLTWHRLGWPKAETLAGGAYDVTHSSHPLLLPARAAAHVITIHDLDFLSHPERTRAEVRRDYPALVQAHAGRADRILVPSRSTAGQVRDRLGVPQERLAICPPGAPPWAPRTPLSPSAGYILFFSTLEPRKNVGGLLDAYELLIRSARQASAPLPPPLILAGRATEDAASWLDRIDHDPLKGAVRHIGYVDPAKRRDLYANARLLVQPSFEEGFGMPVLEAMTLGVPVVAANRGSLPEVLGDAGPLVDPDRPADIAEGIRRVLDDAEYAAGCAARGVARARGFQWDETARRVYATYQQAMDNRIRRARPA